MQGVAYIIRWGVGNVGREEGEQNRNLQARPKVKRPPAISFIGLMSEIHYMGQGPHECELLLPRWRELLESLALGSGCTQ